METGKIQSHNGVFSRTTSTADAEVAHQTEFGSSSRARVFGSTSRQRGRGSGLEIRQDKTNFISQKDYKATYIAIKEYSTL